MVGREAKMSKEELMHLAVVLYHSTILGPDMIKLLLPKEQEYILSVISHLEAAESEVLRVAKEDPADVG